MKKKTKEVSKMDASEFEEKMGILFGLRGLTPEQKSLALVTEYGCEACLKAHDLYEPSAFIDYVYDLRQWKKGKGFLFEKLGDISEYKD